MINRCNIFWCGGIIFGIVVIIICLKKGRNCLLYFINCDWFIIVFVIIVSILK